MIQNNENLNKIILFTSGFVYQFHSDLKTQRSVTKRMSVDNF